MSDEFYTKLAQKIVYSSLWEEDGDTCKVWITLLGLKDRDGFVDKNVTGIARIAKLSVETVEEAMVKFQAPDPKSSSPEFEGRRIEKTEQGWYVLNHDKYQEYGWTEEKKKSERERKAQWRARTKKVLPATAEPKDKWHKDTRTVLHLLNEATGKHFRETESSCGVISARLSEPGVELEGVKKMIERQCRCWKGGRLGDYLQPSTLFGKEKFDNYYAARDQPVILTDQPTGKHDRNAGTYNALRLGQYSNVGKNLNPETPPT